MQIKLSYISERDIDLLIIQEISSSKDFLFFLMNKLNINNSGEIISIFHSLMHPTLGESDIVVVLNIYGIRHALFIENKIDAIAMKNQYQRYVLRAEEGLSKKEYDRYSIMIMGPKRYLDSNSEASKYPS